jgi:CRP/FNR family cyclic AMP-dependent transcriptional regulator
MASPDPALDALAGETNKVWYLKQNRLFEDVADGDVERYAGIFTMRTLPRKALVFDQFDPARTIFMLKSGSVRIARLTADGKEVTLAVLGKGDIFGEEALFGEGPRTTFAVVVAETLLCMARADDLLELLKEEPKLALNVAKVMSDRVVEMTSTVEDLSYTRLTDRLVNVLDRLAAEHGKPCDDGIEITVRLTHADIASLIGSTRETVSLELARLIRSGRVGQRGTTLIVKAKGNG